MGLIAKTKLKAGEEALVLQVAVIERYAGSLIVAARNNPLRVPALEERGIGSTQCPLPGIPPNERLERLQERIVLECVLELMIQHGICFRHQGLLIFPSKFLPPEEQHAEKLPHSVSIYYDFTGAIDNIYASLVTRLIVSKVFGEGRLWPGRLEFDRRADEFCGIRQIKRSGGLAHIDVFFAEETKADLRRLFTRFVEDHLSEHGVEIREHHAIKCRVCGFEISEEIVEENIARGHKDIVCPMCRTETLISEGVEQIRKRDEKSDGKIFALRRTVRKLLAWNASKVKQAIAEDRASITDGPVRILHLSDLHFTKDIPWKRRLEWLLQDLRNGDGMRFDAIHHIVVSGDMTHRGNVEGFEPAREFVSALRDKLSISSIHRCMFVPGNHDVWAPINGYSLRENANGLQPGPVCGTRGVCFCAQRRDVQNAIQSVLG